MRALPAGHLDPRATLDQALRYLLHVAKERGHYGLAGALLRQIAEGKGR